MGCFVRRKSCFNRSSGRSRDWSVLFSESPAAVSSSCDQVFPTLFPFRPASTKARRRLKKGQGKLLSPRQRRGLYVCWPLEGVSLGRLARTSSAGCEITVPLFPIGARLRAAVAAPPCPKGMNIISRRWNLRTKRRALSFWATPQGSNSTPSGLDCILPGTFTVGFTYG